MDSDTAFRARYCSGRDLARRLQALQNDLELLLLGPASRMVSQRKLACAIPAFNADHLHLPVRRDKRSAQVERLEVVETIGASVKLIKILWHAGRWTAAMIPIASGVRVWIATGHTDMRRGMNSLAVLVQEAFKRDPHGGDLYVFRG
jgi:hypothetical protein